MPLSLESNGRSSFADYVSIRDQDFPEEDSDSDSCGSSHSSLGRNSDSSEDCSDRELEDSGEVEKKSALDTMNDLEEDLPVKKGISNFYIGKSKSFTNLADAAGATCVQEIVKAEDPYAKKRKDLLARNVLIGRSRSYANVGGISNSKRTSNLGRRTSCLNLSANADSSDEGKSSTSRSISPPCPLPPRHPQAGNMSSASALRPRPSPPTRDLPLRSYSWSDLNSVAEGHGSYSWSDLNSVAEGHDLAGLAICSGNNDNKVH